MLQAPTYSAGMTPKFGLLQTGLNFHLVITAEIRQIFTSLSGRSLNNDRDHADVGVVALDEMPHSTVLRSPNGQLGSGPGQLHRRQQRDHHHQLRQLVQRYRGERRVSRSHRGLESAGQRIGAHDINLDGWTATIDASETVKSLTLPTNSQLQLFAAGVH